MLRTHFFRSTLSHLMLLVACIWFVSPALNRSVDAQVAAEQEIVVTGEEVPSAYGAPPGFSRSRFSNLTGAYVLPPGGVYVGIIYEGDAFRHGPPDHLFTEEVEVGLPYRFGLAFEVEQERLNGDLQNKSFSLEARYA